MLLAVDIGNTQITLGVFSGERLLGTWRHNTDQSITADQYGVFLSGILRSADISPAGISGVVIASVVPAVAETFAALCRKYLNITPVFVSAALPGAPALCVDSPAEVGADIIANVAGAFALYGGPCIVVDFGTATSFDCISSAGAYLGGAFIPGIETSMQALLQRAALLSAVELSVPPQPIGTNTADCLRSGFIYGFAGQADGILRQLRLRLAPQKVVATGGLASRIAPFCEHIDLVDENITLTGLKLLYERSLA